MAGNLTSTFLWCFMLLMFGTAAHADYQSDHKECSETLLQLTMCLPYVTKEASKPVVTCCSKLKDITDGTKRKCLCVLIRHHDEPTVKNLKIDLERALSLPDACNIPSNVSECPNLLGIDPNSPDGRLFTRRNSGSPNGSPIGANGSGSRKEEKSGCCGRSNYYYTVGGDGLATIWWAVGVLLRGVLVASFVAILAG